MKKILTTLIFITTFLMFAASADAAEINIINKEQLTDSYVYLKINSAITKKYIAKISSNNEVYYSLSPELSEITSHEFTKIDDLNSKITAETITKIKEIMYFGYGYQNRNTDNWYSATQYLIWEALINKANGDDICFIDPLTETEKDSFAYEINIIKSDVERINSRPSFISKERINLLNSDSFLVDFNNNISIFKIVDVDNTSFDSNIFKISGINLYFKFSTPGHHLINIAPNIPKINAESMTYQNSDNEILITRGDLDTNIPIPVNIGVKLNFTFNGEDGPLKDVTFGLYDKIDHNLQTSLTTNELGESSHKTFIMPYYIKVLSVPEGYKLPDTTYALNINNNDLLQSFTFNLEKEEPTKIVNLKTETSSIFQIYNDKDIVESFTLNKDEIKSLNLSLGTYTLKQIIDSEVVDEITLQIDENFENNSTITIKEKVKTDQEANLDVINNSLILKTININSKELITSEAVFKIKDKISGEYLTLNNNETYKTVDGILLLENIPSGEYLIEEISAPKKYRLNKGILEFTIEENDTNIDLIFYQEEENGTISITIIDAITKNPLKDILIGIYNENKELLWQVKTDEQGLIELKNIPVGLYYIKELTTSLELEEIEVEVKDNLKSIITVSNSENDYSLSPDRTEVIVPLTATHEGEYIIYLSFFLLILGLYLYYEKNILKNA